MCRYMAPGLTSGLTLRLVVCYRIIHTCYRYSSSSQRTEKSYIPTRGIDKAPKTPSLPSSPSLGGAKSLKTNLKDDDAGVTADDATGNNAVMAKLLKTSPDDGDDGDDGELQPDSKWEAVL